MKRIQTNCTCHAYPFVHRQGSGKCAADAASVYCGDCGLACSGHQEDHGVGVYEYCGATGVDRLMVEVSDCCGAAVDDIPPAFKAIAPNSTKPTNKGETPCMTTPKPK